MQKDIREYLENLYLTNLDSGVKRTCPKCHKTHRENRLVKDINMLPFKTYVETARAYRDFYRNYCFTCIKSELLLPSRADFL